nr:uncharacterized protein LOC109992137 [Labrus bergylta]
MYKLEDDKGNCKVVYRNLVLDISFLPVVAVAENELCDNESEDWSGATNSLDSLEEENSGEHKCMGGGDTGRLEQWVVNMRRKDWRPTPSSRLCSVHFEEHAFTMDSKAALVFLIRAVEYSIKKLPLKEALLKHTKFLDVQQRAECGVEADLYFVDRFQELLPFHWPQEQDTVSEEFLEYQLMEIPMPQDPTTFNVEEFWGSMPSTKSKVTGLSQFGRLFKIAALVLVRPHSNADAERVFSMVGLNKTKTRNSLALNGTLMSIMTVKTAGLEPQCLKREPPSPLLKASKPATNTYNKQH